MVEEFSPVGMSCQTIEKKIGNTTIKLQYDDLTALPVDALVFYAREDLELGSGYGTAIQTRGGLDIKKELDDIGSIKMGEAVITGAGMMNAKHIIHACGPKFQEEDLEKKLRDCMNNTLKVAGDNQLKSLAFPPMGTGFYGVPVELSADVMLDAITNFLKDETSLEEIIICILNVRDYKTFKERLENI